MSWLLAALTIVISGLIDRVVEWWKSDKKLLAYHHKETWDGYESRDMGGIIYMDDGRVINRKPNQSIRDAIRVGKELK